MAIPSSGPLSISIFNEELSRTSNTANSKLAGGSTPTTDSLVYLAGQVGTLNQIPPFAFSQWYGFTANQPATLTDAFLKYDPYSSSYDNAVAVNLGTGGSLYNLYQTGSIKTGSYGTASYYDINSTSIGTQSFWVDRGPNLSGSDWAVSIMFAPTNLAFNGFNARGGLFGVNTWGSYNTNFSGMSVETIDGSTDSIFSGVWSGSETGGGSSNILGYYYNNNLLFNWWHYVSTFKNLGGGNVEFKTYVNNILNSTDTAGTFIPALTTGYKIKMGIQYLIDAFGANGSPGGYRVGSVSFWTGSLSGEQVNILYQEFYNRYSQQTITTTTSTTTTTTTATVSCGAGTTYSGQQVYPFTQNVTLGSSDPSIVVLDFNAQNVPDLFVVTWNGNVYSTGYRGSSIYNIGGTNRDDFQDSMIGRVDPFYNTTYPDTTNYPDDGYPLVTSPGDGQLSFIKATSSPTNATLQVYGPAANTAWTATLQCPDFYDITSDAEPSPSAACADPQLNPEPTRGNGTTFCNSTTLSNSVFSSLSTGTYYIAYAGNYVQVSITNGNQTATVTSACSSCPVPTTTTTSTTTTTTTVPSIAYCLGYSVDNCCAAESDYDINCAGPPP